MNEKKHSQVGRLFNYANNPITITGAVLAILAALLIAIFITIHMFGGHQSAYTGILAFAILPAIFVTGLLIIPVGMWFRRRKLQAAHVSEAELDAYPRLDFNDPHLRRVVMVFIGLTFLNAVLRRRIGALLKRARALASSPTREAQVGVLAGDLLDQAAPAVRDVIAALEQLGKAVQRLHSMGL